MGWSAELDEGDETAPRGKEGYKRLKEQIHKNLLEGDQDISPETMAFLNAAAPEPLRPIIINIPPTDGGSGVGYIGGLLFTMWLVANMS